MQAGNNKVKGSQIVPNELETKIISCYKQITFPSICLILQVDEAFIYKTLKKFNIHVKAFSDPGGFKYGKKQKGDGMSYVSNRSKRLVKPYKTNQL